MLINFQEKQKWGYYNTDTAKTISAQFCNAVDFKDGYVTARHDYSSNYGVIDENGNEILPFVFPLINYEGNHIFKVESSSLNCLYNQFGKIVDKKGNELPSNLQIYQIVQYINADLYRVKTQDNKEGIVYRGDLTILLDGHRDIKSISNGLIILSEGYSHRWLYDFMGKKIASEYCDYDIVSDRYIIVDAGSSKGMVLLI